MPTLKNNPRHHHLETQYLNMQLLPEENEKNTQRRMRSTFSTSVMCERTAKFPLELFMVLANITSTNTEGDYGISFPELYEIYK
jgi:hypothetical protein